MSTKNPKTRLDKQMTNGYKMFSLVYLLSPCINNKHANLKTLLAEAVLLFQAFFLIQSTHKFIKDITYKSRKVGNMLLFHYSMVINIRQECKIVLISKKTEKFSIFSSVVDPVTFLHFFQTTIPVGYIGKSLMGTLSSQRRDGIFLCKQHLSILRRQKTAS